MDSPILISDHHTPRESLPGTLWELQGHRGGQSGKKLYHSRENALNTRRTLLRVAEVLSAGADPHTIRTLLHGYSQEDEHKADLPKGTLEDAALSVDPKHPLQALHQYLAKRATYLPEHPSPWLHNPDLSTHLDPSTPAMEQVHNLTHGNLQVMPVAPSQIPTTSLIHSNVEDNGEYKLDHSLGDVVKAFKFKTVKEAFQEARRQGLNEGDAYCPTCGAIFEWDGDPHGDGVGSCNRCGSHDTPVEWHADGPEDDEPVEGVKKALDGPPKNPWEMTRSEFEASHPVHRLNYSSGRGIEEALQKGVVYRGHPAPSHDVDKTLAALRHHELEEESKSVTDPGRMRSLVGEQFDLRSKYPDLGKVNLGYREVDTRGTYVDHTNQTAQRTARGGGTSGKVYFTKPYGSSLNVSTNEGFKNLLLAKKEAIAKGGNYPETLRKTLIGKGYDSVHGGGIDAGEQASERIYLHRVAPTTHEQVVKTALRSGLPVPSHVLGEYPNLQQTDTKKALPIETEPEPATTPTKTVRAYKLFRIDKRQPGKLFPLFVDSNTPVPMGKWVDAKMGEQNEKGGVKSKIGPLAFRPGWHAGDLPVATHIGGKSGGSEQVAPDYRPNNHVWAEVEMPNDVDWQSVATERGRNSSGKVVAPKAHITDQLPVGGHYRYKTNSNMTGNWLIGGSMKVNRVLPDAEVESINRAAGAKDLPRIGPSMWSHEGVQKAWNHTASLRRAESQTHPNPTPAQIAAENARRGKFQWRGLTITIEQPKGSIRRGKNPNHPWEVTMGCAYGYFNSQPLGRDGDPCDVFVCDENLDSDIVFIVNQLGKDGKSFDEHKVIIGCNNETQARKAYLSCYSPGWKVGPIKSLTVEDFKKWLASGKRGVVKAMGGRNNEGDGVWWHGSVSPENLRGGQRGLHLGTHAAAHDALNAAIGFPAVGHWDGTREYGSTLMAGTRTLRSRGLNVSGRNAGRNHPEEDYYQHQHPDGPLTYSNGDPVDPKSKPAIKPFEIIGPMSNSVYSPHPDWKANGYMQGNLKKGTAKRGYFYKNEGEDSGSISAVVPNGSHVRHLPEVRPTNPDLMKSLGQPILIIPDLERASK